MKKTIFLFAIGLLIISCNKEYDRAMKSAEKDYILQVADKQFEKQKWENAINLYDRVKKLVAGTDEAKKVIYRTAYANYNSKNYRLAGNQFKNYAYTYYTDSLAEETLYLSATCYYKGSLDYNLDNENTDLAIKEMQEFVNKYPNSKNVSQANIIINELQLRKEKKAFENAKTMYKIGQYKASSVMFDNAIEDFPDTKFREELMMYILRSKTNLAKESTFELKKERLTEALTSYRNLIKDYPNSQFKNEAENLKSDIEKEVKLTDEQAKKIEEYKQKNKTKTISSNS